MDLPVKLEDNAFVSSMDELKQTIGVMLKTPLNEFCQDYKLGSYVSIHETDEDNITEAINRTLEEIQGLTCENIVNNGNNSYTVTVMYRGNIVDFQFNVGVL